MPFLTACQHCNAQFRVADNALGKRAKCTKCGQAFIVSAANPTLLPVQLRSPAAVTAQPLRENSGPPSARRPVPVASTNVGANSSTIRSRPAPSTMRRTRLTEQELMAAFEGPLKRLRPRLSYRIGILLVALTMIVLPLVYLGVIGLVGYGVYYHAVHHTGLLQLGHGRSRGLFALVYIAPIVAGTIAVFFMFKPLLARPSHRERSRSLTRQSEPLLFAFVDRICEVVGAPRPKRIDVDCEVNASAHFRRGMFSMLGHDLVLTVGLPLAAGLTIREFGGVLAHEFGHFAQGAGMRLTYLSRSIVNWFVRVVYQRDQWDDWLEQSAQELDFRIGWILVVAQLFVLIGRGVLWVLLHIGLAISGLMLRQMEYDADRYGVRFAGTDAFVPTHRRIHLLAGASQLAQMQLSRSLERQQLVNDLPALTLHYARTAGPDVLKNIEKQIAESKTGWFDSHPSTADRVAAAEALASPGIFRLERQAAELFSHFTAQSEATTWDLYCSIFGATVPRSALLSVPAFAADFGSINEAAAPPPNVAAYRRPQDGPATIGPSRKASSGF